jgi:hypothetical protein
VHFDFLTGSMVFSQSRETFFALDHQYSNGLRCAHAWPRIE